MEKSIRMVSSMAQKKTDEWIQIDFTRRPSGSM